MFKVGFLCLIGIAHLPEKLSKLRFYKQFELRPCITTDLGPMIEEQLPDDKVPKNAKPIIANLFHAIKLICAKVLPVVPHSGNIQCEGGILQVGQTGPLPDFDSQSMVVDHYLRPIRLQDSTYNNKQSAEFYYYGGGAGGRQQSADARSFSDFPIKPELQSRLQ